MPCVPVRSLVPRLNGSFGTASPKQHAPPVVTTETGYVPPPVIVQPVKALSKLPFVSRLSGAACALAARSDMHKNAKHDFLSIDCTSLMEGCKRSAICASPGKRAPIAARHPKTK